MNATKLRIGNYVEYANVTCEVQSYSKEGFLQTDGVTAPITAYQAIEISERWLLKFGFSRQPWGLVKGELLFKDNNHECKELTLEVGNGFRTTVKYLHELQNLYFALTNEELTTINNSR